MKILIITSSLPPSGGAEKVAWDLALSLKNNNEVHVITFGSEDTIKNIEGITVYFLKQRSHGLWYYLTIGRKRILNITNQIKPDIINAHMHSVVAFILRFYPEKKVLTLHNSQYEHYNKTFIQKFKHNIFTRKTIEKYDVVTTVSKHMQNYFINMFNREIVHIANGINREIFVNENKQRGKIILYVGRLVDFKGVRILFEMAKIKKEYKFIFIGDGPLKNIINLPNVEFVGIKDSQEISRYYNKARFAIFPSKYENFPLVGLEAMACGAIVIANEINGFQEYIVNKENGFLVKKMSIKNIIDNFERISQRKDLELIKTNAVNTSNEYSLNKISNLYMNLFNN